MELNFKDNIIVGVSPKKNGDMVFKIHCKAQDFSADQRIWLETLWSVGDAIDIDIKAGEDSTPKVNQATGEITNSTL